MKKKITKTREEVIAESYFPVDETDLKHTTEKQEKETPSKEDFTKRVVEKEYKKLERTSLEIVEHRSVYPKLRSKGVKPTRKYKKRKSKIKKVKYVPPKISLKKNGYELVITEKPQAGLKIATALGNATQMFSDKIPYYEVDRDGKKIIVACAVGHLFTLNQNVSGSGVPIFDIDWAPNYVVRKKDFTKKYYNLLLKLARNAGSVTIATDFDIEGEVIGLNVARFICNQKDANRMNFSTLTSDELNQAYKKKSKNINWGHAIAGESRHYLDWFYGINLSRALMHAIKTTGKFRIMSIGRVQGPALNLIVKKEKEIQKFKPEKYWQVFINVKNSHILELKFNKEIFEKTELKKFENLNGRTAQASTKKAEQILPPNPPFNLTTLQTEAYKFYGLVPAKTLRIAQSLYLAGLISYPRTSSQKLPESVGYKVILKKLAKKYNVEKLITKKKPVEGKKLDPAHPSIYPTGNSQILSGDDEKIYELIVKRFLSLFCDCAVIDKKIVTAQLDGLIRHDPKLKGGFDKGNQVSLYFSVRGSSVRKKAWMEIYPSKLKENEIPDLDGEVKIIKVRTEEKETQPPRRYSPASILSELEKKNLGTKATRAAILETLENRGYIKDRNVKATPLGISLIGILEKYSKIIIDEKLTRDLEEEMEEILNSKKGLKDKQKILLEKAKKIITQIAYDFEKNEEKIGKELLTANIQQREQQKIENKLCVCPVCKKGNLAITYSRKTKRFFVACDAYPNCKTTYSLPPNGTIKKTNKLCEKCGFPMLMCLKARRKPWFFCFNSDCETNKERIEEYRKKREGEKFER